MGIVDAQLLLSDFQALTVAAPSTNSIDLRAERAIGTGTGHHVELTIDVAAAGTLTAAIQVDDNSAFSTPRTISTVTLAAADMPAGSIHYIPIPGGVATERHMRVYYTPSAAVTVTASVKPRNFVQANSRYVARNYEV